MRPGLGLGGARGGARVLGLGVHTELSAAVLRQFGAGHPLRPLEAVFLHDWKAALLGSLTDRPAGWERPGIALHADGSVHRAQEEPQVRRALDLDERPELVNLQTSLTREIISKTHLGSCQDTEMTVMLTLTVSDLVVV